MKALLSPPPSQVSAGIENVAFPARELGSKAMNTVAIRSKAKRVSNSDLERF
jgi:hypothetical protein